MKQSVPTIYVRGYDTHEEQNDMIIIGKPAPEALHAKLPAHSLPMLPIRLLRDRRGREQGKNTRSCNV